MFEGLTLEELKVKDWNCIEIGSKNLMLFHKDIYKPEKDCDGFYFMCVSFVCEEMVSNVVGYDVVFEGTAYFDGVRHLYFGKEETQNYGYLYYQDIPSLIEALQALDKLQIEKCSYVREERNDNTR